MRIVTPTANPNQLDIAVSANLYNRCQRNGVTRLYTTRSALLPSTRRVPHKQNSLGSDIGPFGQRGREWRQASLKSGSALPAFQSLKKFTLSLNLL